MDLTEYEASLPFTRVPESGPGSGSPGNVVERLSVLPLGKYEDGSINLALPELLAPSHGGRFADTPYEIRQAVSMALGGMGASPFAAIPKGALGMNALRRGHFDDMPFDLPAAPGKAAKGAPKEKPSAPAIKRDDGEIFDYTSHDQLPPGNPLNMEKLEPYKGRGPNADMEALLKDGRVTRAVNRTVEAGLSPELRDITLNWYNMLPLRERFHDLYKGKDADAAFLRFNQSVGSMSPQSRVPENMAQGSWLYGLLEKGKPIPKEPPAGYGGNAMKTRLSVARKKFGQEEGHDYSKAPKTEFFGRSLAGDDSVPVVDSHAIRTMAMATKDPRFMLGSLRKWDDRTRTATDLRPRDSVLSGEMSLKDALQDPTLWGWRNDGAKYASSAVPFMRSAEKLGISPGQAQAASWYGNAAQTGVQTKPQTAMQILEQKIREHATKWDKLPEQVLKDIINGDDFLMQAPVSPFAPVPQDAQ